LRRPRNIELPDGQAGSYLGPSYTHQQIVTTLDSIGAVYEIYDSEALLAEAVAALLDSGKVVGHFHGRMEFGPRALGARSILGDARSDDTQATMNQKIKFRESFRPFAPSCLEDEASEYFELDRPSPYMLFVAPVRRERLRELTGEERALEGLSRLRVRRSDIPAVTHVDDSARIQTVNAAMAPRYHRLLRAFSERTGCGVIVNTSFNIRGEPIVCSPEDAYRCFMATQMDALVVGNCLCMKPDQPELLGVAEHRRRFLPD
jgi:carbamoyltransferase